MVADEDPGAGDRARAVDPRRWAAALAGAAAWAMAVPYAGGAAGIELDVPAGVEVADHVVPGAIVLLAAGALAAAARGGRSVEPGDVGWSLAAGSCFLAGFWIASTHVPLVAEAIDGITGWAAALLHTSAGVPLLALGAWMLALPFLGASGRR